MQLYFQKPTKKSGYAVQMIVDLDEKTIKRGYFLFSLRERVKLAAGEFEKLFNRFKENGYTVKEDY